MCITFEKLTVAVSAAGAATEYSANRIKGKLLGIFYDKVDYTNGVVFLITSETSGQTLWSETGVNATTKRYPRIPTHDGLGAASLYAGSGEPVEDKIPLLDERVKIVLASGGTSTTGTFTLVWEE